MTPKHTGRQCQLKLKHSLKVVVFFFHEHANMINMLSKDKIPVADNCKALRSVVQAIFLCNGIN